MTNPFKFLDAYTKEDIGIFFGRTKEVEEVYGKIFKGNLLLIYGASGTGKTSLLNCGVADKFQDTDWFPVNIRRKTDLLDSSRKEIDRLALTAIPPETSLPEAFQSLYLDFFKPVYAIFDQFEELFISGSGQEQLRFIEFLTGLLGKGYNIKVIISIREEYIASFSAFEEEIPGFFDNRYRVEHMRPSRADDVIIQTCGKTGIILGNGTKEDGERIAGRIVANILSPDGHLELTYLQVYLDRLFTFATKKDANAPVFSDALLEDVGSIGDVLSLFLEEQVAKTENPDLAWKILKSFVTGEGTKKMVTATSIQEYFRDNNWQISDPDLSRYLQHFLHLKIIRNLDDLRIFEVVHDNLAKKIWDKISIEDRNLLESKNLVNSAFRNHQARKTYLTKQDLDFIAPYGTRLNLDPEKKAFVDKSRRRIRNQRWMMIGAITAVIILLSLSTLFSLNQKEKAFAGERAARHSQHIADSNLKRSIQSEQAARNSKHIADSNLKLADSNAYAAQRSRDTLQIEKDKEAGLLRQTDSVLNITRMSQTDPTEAFDAVFRLYPSINTARLRSALRQVAYTAFDNILYGQKLVLAGTPEKVDIDSRQTFAVITDHSNRLHYWDLEKGASFELKGHPATVKWVAISRFSRRFATLDDDNNLFFWNDDHRFLRQVKLPGLIADFKALSTRDQLVVGFKNGNLQLYDFSGNGGATQQTDLQNILSITTPSSGAIDFYTLSDNSRIMGWNRRQCERGCSLSIPDGAARFDVNAMDISGDTLAALARNDSVTVFRLNIPSAENSPPGEVLLRHKASAPIGNLQLVGPHQLVFATDKADLVYYDFGIGKIRTLQNSYNSLPVNDLKKGGTFTSFLTTGDDHSVKIWDPVLTEPLIFQVSGGPTKKIDTRKENAGFDLQAIAGAKNFDSILVLQSGGFAYPDSFYPEKENVLLRIGKEDTLKLVTGNKVEYGIGRGASLSVFDGRAPVLIVFPVIPGSKNDYEIVYAQIGASGNYFLIRLRNRDYLESYYYVYPLFNVMQKFFLHRKNTLK